MDIWVKKCREFVVDGQIWGEVDHKRVGMKLYKIFRELNIQCGVAQDRVNLSNPWKSWKIEVKLYMMMT